MTHVKRAAALFVCICMVFILFASFAFIAHQACHDCVGERCGVCKRIEEVKAMLQSFSLLIPAALLLTAVLFIHRFLHTMEGFRLHTACTLVTWKVRLND